MIIYDDLPEYGRLISFPPSEALAALVEDDKRLAREAVAAWLAKREPAPAPFETDVSGSPSQSQCSPAHLANIIAARDEDLARKAAQTVRAVEE